MFGLYEVICARSFLRKCPLYMDTTIALASSHGGLELTILSHFHSNPPFMGAMLELQMITF